MPHEFNKTGQFSYAHGQAVLRAMRGTNVVRAGTLRWAQHVACKVLVGKSEGKRFLKDLDIDGRYKFKKRDGAAYSRFL